MSGLSVIAQAALDQARSRSKPATKRREWTAEEESRLIKLYPDTPMPELESVFSRHERAIYSKAGSMGLKRSEAYMASEHACRLRKGDNVGEAFRFKAGQTPWNKGAKGWAAPGTEATRFKPGNKPHTWVPIGTEQIRDGYLWRKVTDNGGRHDWKQVHVILWEENNGSVPAGFILVFKDRNKTNIQIDNLELITRAENCRRNSIHRYPPELKHAIRKLAKLKRTIEDKANEEST